MAAVNKDRVTPFMATHPGFIIKNELGERKIKPAEFARMTGIQKSHLSEIINEKAPVTKATADKLEAALGIPAVTWITLQVNYDYDVKVIAERDENERKAVGEEKAYLEIVNLRELYKRLRISTESFARERVARLKSLLPCDILTLPSMEGDMQGYFKRSDKLQIDERNMRTWLLLARTAAGNASQETEYKEGGAVAAAKEIARMANDKTLTIESIRGCLSSQGISYVEVPKLDKTPVDAYSVAVGAKRIIAVTYRYDDMDKLAFDILHELCHIDRHMDADGRAFISIEGGYSKSPIEMEANMFARDMLIPPMVWKGLIGTGCKSLSPHVIADTIAQEAEKLGISKSIAISRYKHDSNVYNIRKYKSPKIVRR